MKNLKEYKDTNDLTSKLSPHESILFHLPLLLFTEDIYMVPKSNLQNKVYAEETGFCPRVLHALLSFRSF